MRKYVKNGSLGATNRPLVELAQPVNHGRQMSFIEKLYGKWKLGNCCKQQKTEAAVCSCSKFHKYLVFFLPFGENI